MTHPVFDLPTSACFDAWKLRCLLYCTQDVAVLQVVADSLASGVMAHAVKAAHEAFESGADLSQELEDIARHAWETRVVFPDVLARIASDDPAFMYLCSTLAYSDEVLRDYTGAVFTIDDDFHDRVTWDLSGELCHHEWWGARARVNAAIPRGVVENALHALGEQS